MCVWCAVCSCFFLVIFSVVNLIWFIQFLFSVINYCAFDRYRHKRIEWESIKSNHISVLLAISFLIVNYLLNTEQNTRHDYNLQSAVLFCFSIKVPETEIESKSSAFQFDYSAWKIVLKSKRNETRLYKTEMYIKQILSSFLFYCSLNRTFDGVNKHRIPCEMNLKKKIENLNRKYTR